MRHLSWSIPALLLASAEVMSQPSPPPASGDALCGEPPGAPVEPDLSKPDADGFHSLFNGVDFAGWWLDCRGSGHSIMSPDGPIFRVDTVRKALFSTQRGNVGGVLLTKAKFKDYEIEFDYWPGWGNEAALHHRTDTNGRAYSTTLGYASGTAIGGVWGENGLVARDLRPFNFGATDTNISIFTWTRLTRDLKAAGENIPCPDSGCTQEDWRRLWNTDNWNQMRVTFHGGNNPEDPIHARSWFRKLGASEWVPLMADTTLRREIKPGFIGLMVHGSGRFAGPRGTWYRNIRWRPWPHVATSSVPGPLSLAAHRPAFRVDGEGKSIHVVFADAAATRDIRVLSPDGKTMARLRDIRGEARIGTAGWKRGVYLVSVGADGNREWKRVLLP